MKRNKWSGWVLALMSMATVTLVPAAQAEPTGETGWAGRLLATGGASAIEGGAGGGIVPWAVIAGYGSEGQWGGSAVLTRVQTDDYRLDVHGLAVGWSNRIELSLAEQRLGLPTLAAALGLPVDRFRQRIVSAKLRLAGDLVYSDLPQLSLSAQHKQQRDFAVPALVGARDDSDIDWVLGASKLWLAGAGGYNLLGSLNLRYSRANQTGLLGFGGDLDTRRDLLLEGSLAVLWDRHWAVGVEYRQKPDKLSFAREDDWKDLFVAWFPSKRVALVAAWADLGSVASLADQRGWYLSLQVSQ